MYIYNYVYYICVYALDIFILYEASNARLLQTNAALEAGQFYAVEILEC